MRFGIVTAAAALVVAANGAAYAASSYSVIYDFTGVNDGGFPHGGLIADASGALYGTASSDGADHNGTVYKLTPPAPGNTRYKETTLYAFTGGADGAIPYANLLADNTGALYGTTYAGGDSNGDGVVFELTPSQDGKTYKETVIHRFANGNDGAEPWSTLISDSSGNLYGTTTEGGSGVVGTVFELSPPAPGKTIWKETILYNFTGNNDGGEPFGAVLLGKDGSLYGTTAGYGQYNYGTVYQLTPPAKAGGTWGFNLLHAFSGGNDGEVPRAGLISDSSGALYGTTAGFDNSYGTVFKLTESKAGAWKEDVLYRFRGMGFQGNGPWQAVSLDASGALYGTTLGVGRTADGEIFKLTPPAKGSTKWTPTVLHAFRGGKSSQFPYSNVLVAADGTLFGTASGSAGQDGFFPGVVWKITQ